MKRAAMEHKIHQELKHQYKEYLLCFNISVVDIQVFSSENSNACTVVWS